MKILKAGHTTDIAHTMHPYLLAALKEYDAVIVSPAMGFDQFEPFGKRVIVDCCATPVAHYTTDDGRKVWQRVEEMALAHGLSVITHNPIETGEMAEKEKGDSVWE